MKAIIMAGGEGTRLRPLTCDCPKPMLPLLGKPLMEYAIQLLKNHGVTEIAATLGYLPDIITDYFGDGSAFGVNLRYYTEKTPLGTAGSVKQAENFLDERFIVLSGDGITDFDLHSALDFHQKNDAQATLLLKKCGNPQEYGMVVTDSEGRIKSFHEKPGRCDVFSDRINTGIYILEPEILRRVPDGTAFDFGHDLFPLLLDEGAAMYGLTMAGYWCDVGDVPAYLRAHRDALDGKIRLNNLPNQPTVSTDGAILESGCRIESPCFIGKNTTISAGAHIGPYTVIGENCSIEIGAGVKRSVVFSNTHVDIGAQLRGCIVGNNARVRENAQLYEDSVVGSRSSIGARAILPPGVKLWPDKALPEGERPEDNIVWGSCRQKRFIGGGLEIEAPMDAARAAQACSAEINSGEILLGRESCGASIAVWHAAVAGLMAQGVRLIDAGECTLPQLRYIQRSLRTTCAILAGASSLIPLNSNGSLFGEKQQRAILKRCERQDFAVNKLALPMESAGRGDITYIAHAASAFRTDPSLAPKITLFAQSSHLLSLAERAFARTGLRIRCEWDARNMHPHPDEIGVYLSNDGQSANFSDFSGLLDDAHRQLLIAWTALQSGENRLLLHNSGTRAIEILTGKCDAQAIYLPGEYAHWMNCLAENAIPQFDLHFDGIYSALSCLSALTEKGLSLDQWKKQMPLVYRKTAAVPIPPSECGRLLHIIAEGSAHTELGGGVRIAENSRWAWLSPDESSASLRIMAESASMEAAMGMCDSLEQRILHLIKP